MSKTTKNIILLPSMLDYKTMEKFFEDMAARGWILEKASLLNFKFKKTEPKNLKFSVDIFPDIKVFDSFSNRSLREYKELCQESGWQYLCAANRWQIFYSESKDNLTPIHTDSIIEEKIAKKSFFSAINIILFISIFYTYIIHVMISNYNFLFINIGIIASIYYPILAIPIIIYGIYHLFWFWKAKQNIKKGIPLPKTTIRAVKFRGWLLLTIGAFLITILSIASIADAINFEIPFAILILLIPILYVFLILWLRKMMAKKERSRKKNAALFAAGFFTLLILSFTIVSTVLYIYDGKNSTKNELPGGYIALELSDFGIEGEIFIKSFYFTSSIIVPKSYHYHEGIIERGFISTEYIKTIHPFISEYIFNEMLKSESKKYLYSSIEAPIEDWNVDKAYYLDKNKTRILLLKNNFIIKIESHFDLTKNENINIILEKFNLN